MSSKRWFAYLVLLLGFSHCLAQPTAKVATIAKVRSTTGQLFQIAQDRVRLGESERSSLTREVDRILQHERDPDVLARVALISSVYMNPGSAGDETFDDVFDIAWETCVRRIEQTGGQPAIDALEQIKSNMRLDGGYSLLWEESMERLKMNQQKNKQTR